MTTAVFKIDGEINDPLNLQGIDVQTHLTGKDLAALMPVIGEKLPATDQFDIQGRLTGSSKQLSLKNVQAAAKRGGLQLTLNGKVQDILALKGMDLGLFYIPTQAHIAEDMQPRLRAVENSLKALGIEKTY